MKIRVDTPTEDVQIQIIPLIDVIFCILTFFILASLQLTRQQAVNVALPKTGAGAPAEGSQSTGRPVVYIDASGLTSLDGRPIDRARLRQTLQEYYQKNPTGVLLLYADKNAFYENVLQVFAVMQEVGGDRAALATDPGSPSGATPAPTANPTAPTGSPTLAPFPLYGTPNPYSPLPGQPFSPNTNPVNPGTLPNSYPGSNPGSGSQRSQ